MKTKKAIQPAAWAQGYHPTQAPPTQPSGQNNRPASAVYHTCFRTFAKRHALLLVLGFLLLLSGAGILVHQMVTSANVQKANAELQAIYYAAARQEAAQRLVVTVAPVSPPTTRPIQKAAKQPRTFVTPQPMLTYATRERFLPLLKINRDVVGWLTIPAVLDLPVVQRDNTFYLTHSFQGKASDAGALFLDQHFSLIPPYENLLIHGHNMRDGSMFGQLFKYRKKSFYIKHWLIQLETLHEEGNYVIFAVFDMVNDLSSPAYYPYAYPGFDTDQRFEEYIAGVKQRSVFQCDISVLPADTLLTLSTCVGGGGSNYLVVVARKIRDGENLTTLTTTCLTATFDTAQNP